MHRVAWLAFSLLALTACRVTNLPLWGPSESLHRGYDVDRVRDIAYHDGPDADSFRHSLDLFVPKGTKDFPVVVLIHGGAWMVGDNRCCGLYSSVGEYLASQGIGAVLPNYRLAPSVKHPEHIRDVARAFAWTKKHIAEHGGRPDRIVVAGHSAGGHLAALLATDERYLCAAGCRTADIKGVVGISGVYRIPAGNADVLLGGPSALALRLDEMAPLRGRSGPGVTLPEALALPISVNVFGPPFGNDPEVRADASPVHHVRRGLPPFLLLSAENDLPLLPGMAAEMHDALVKHGGSSKLVRIAGRNHNSIMFKAIESEDPVARAMVDFVKDVAAKD